MNIDIVKQLDKRIRFIERRVPEKVWKDHGGSIENEVDQEGRYDDLNSAHFVIKTFIKINNYNETEVVLLCIEMIRNYAKKEIKYCEDLVGERQTIREYVCAIWDNLVLALDEYEMEKRKSDDFDAGKWENRYVEKAVREMEEYSSQYVKSFASVKYVALNTITNDIDKQIRIFKECLSKIHTH